MKTIFRAFALGLIAAATLASGCARNEPAAAVGGDFDLVDQNGRAVDETILKGKWSAVFFGFTYCPDVCPMTLQALAEAKARLGPKAERLQVVFISVDPERDTPKALKAYLASEGFPKGAVGLTGSPQAIDRAAKAYKAFYRKSGEGADYQMQHSSVVYLMDPKGRFDRVLAYGLTPEEMTRQISDAMR